MISRLLSFIKSLLKSKNYSVLLNAEFDHIYQVPTIG